MKTFFWSVEKFHFRQLNKNLSSVENFFRSVEKLFSVGCDIFWSDEKKFQFGKMVRQFRIILFGRLKENIRRFRNLFCWLSFLSVEIHVDIHRGGGGGAGGTLTVVLGHFRAFWAPSGLPRPASGRPEQ